MLKTNIDNSSIGLSPTNALYMLEAVNSSAAGGSSSSSSSSLSAGAIAGIAAGAAVAVAAAAAGAWLYVQRRRRSVLGSGASVAEGQLKDQLDGIVIAGGKLGGDSDARIPPTGSAPPSGGTVASAVTHSSMAASAWTGTASDCAGGAPQAAAIRSVTHPASVPAAPPRLASPFVGGPRPGAAPAASPFAGGPRPPVAASPFAGGPRFGGAPAPNPFMGGPAFSSGSGPSPPDSLAAGGALPSSGPSSGAGSFVGASRGNSGIYPGSHPSSRVSFDSPGSILARGAQRSAPLGGGAVVPAGGAALGGPYPSGPAGVRSVAATGAPAAASPFATVRARATTVPSGPLPFGGGEQQGLTSPPRSHDSSGAQSMQSGMLSGMSSASALDYGSGSQSHMLLPEASGAGVCLWLEML